MLLVVASYFLSVMAAGSLFVLPLVVAVRDSDEDGWVSGFLDRQVQAHLTGAASSAAQLS